MTLAAKSASAVVNLHSGTASVPHGGPTEKPHQLTRVAASVEDVLQAFDGKCAYDASGAGVCAAPRNTSTIAKAMTKPAPGGVTSRLAGGAAAVGGPSSTLAASHGADAATPIDHSTLAAGASPNTKRLIATRLAVAPMYVPDDPVEGKRQITAYMLEHRFNKKDVTDAIVTFNKKHERDPGFTPVTPEDYAKAYADMTWAANQGPIQGKMRTIAILDEGTTSTLTASSAEDAAAHSADGKVGGLAPAVAAELNVAVMHHMQAAAGVSAQQIARSEARAASWLSGSITIGKHTQFTPPSRTRPIISTSDAAARQAMFADAPPTGPVAGGTVAAAEARDAVSALHRQSLALLGAHVAMGRPAAVAALTNQRSAHRIADASNRRVHQFAIAESVAGAFPYARTISGIHFG